MESESDIKMFCLLSHSGWIEVEIIVLSKPDSEGEIPRGLIHAYMILQRLGMEGCLANEGRGEWGRLTNEYSVRN